MLLTKREIEQTDKSNMFYVLAAFPSQAEEAIQIGDSLNSNDEYKNVNKIIITGLGGSAIGGDLLRSYLHYEIKIPIFVNRNYRLPAFADENTLVIVSSYSGTTEESISAYEDAKNRNCKIVCLTSGGKLEIYAESENRLLIKVPRGYQPRCAIAYSFFPLMIFFMHLGFIQERKDEIINCLDFVRKKSFQYSKIESNENVAMGIANHLKGKIPVIYSSTDVLDIVNLRWRCQINENAKCLAFGNYLPEMNHNEITGWQENPDSLQNFVIVSLVDREDNPRIIRRLSITLDIIHKQHGTKLIEVDAEGETRLERLMDLIHLGDWVSFYLAIMYKTDPSPIEKINILKNKLSEI